VVNTLWRGRGIAGLRCTAFSGARVYIFVGAGSCWAGQTGGRYGHVCWRGRSWIEAAAVMGGTRPAGPSLEPGAAVTPTSAAGQAPAAILGHGDLAVTDLDVFKISSPPAGYPTNIRTFYSPIDHVPQVLQSVISSVTKSIVVAMYGFDDDVLAGMLATALNNPAIYVQITLDASQAAGAHEKDLLGKYFHDLPGNSIAIGKSERGAIMHRKMVIVDGLWRISGSTNWSASGETLQDNELTIIRDAVVCAEARPILDIEHDTALKHMAATRG
jgi:phosphatidylserine/phosphatidylglycerophosphate/cardiolipin synthase-like enzyme